MVFLVSQVDNNLLAKQKSLFWKNDHISGYLISAGF